jgi:hypothetical protein
LVEAGLADHDALEALFGVVTVLAEQGALPPFPEEDDDLGRAEWLVAATDLDLFDVLVSSLREG